jgi:hypothetical protein
MELENKALSVLMRMQQFSTKQFGCKEESQTGAQNWMQSFFKWDGYMGEK